MSNLFNLQSQVGDVDVTLLLGGIEFFKHLVDVVCDLEYLVLQLCFGSVQVSALHNTINDCLKVSDRRVYHSKLRFGALSLRGFKSFYLFIKLSGPLRKFLGKSFFGLEYKCLKGCFIRGDLEELDL